MSNAIQLVFFLRMLATGIIAPVLALMLLAHGATIETISLLIGAYSVTVVAAEFPSGVLSDLFGQKRVFLLSTVFALLCYILVLVSRSAPVLLLAMVCNGLSRAFASGTLDALAVNQTPERSDAALLGITSRFAVLESAGLAAGALAGGLMAGIGNIYAVNIIVNACLYVLVFFLSLAFIRETRSRAEGCIRVSMRGRMNRQLKEIVSFIVQKGIVRTILVLSAVTGFALISVETYWQPAYTAYDPAPWTLGLITFGCFFSVMLGSKLTESILKKHENQVPAAFLILRGLFGAGLIALYFTTGAAPFASACLVSYFFLGGGSVAENTLIHRAAKDEQRSSVVSLFSFVVQIGGVLASGIGFLVSMGGYYQLMWPIAGALLLLCAGMRGLHRKQKQA